MNKKEKNYLYLTYTIFFVLIAGYIIFAYYSKGKSLIDYSGDGFRQHYRALLYYSNYLKEIFRNIFVNRKLVIPQFDYVIGEGSDILQTFHYYTIGDPISFFSVFVPERYMYLFYDLTIFVRLYLAGFVFSRICINHNKKNWIIILTGSLSYAFCYFALNALKSHFFFVNVLLYGALVILGVDKIFNNKKPYLFTIAVMLSALSSIYFFYIIVVTTVIYVIVRLLFFDSTLKERIKLLFKIGVFAVMGALMSFVITLPMLFVLLGNSRLDINYAFHWFYNIGYYKSLLTTFTLNETRSYYGGYTIPCLLAIALLFLEKKNKVLKTLTIIAFSFFLLPIFSKFFNGMSYIMNYRWCWIVNLLLCYVFVEIFDETPNIDKHYKCLFITSAIFFVVNCINDADYRIKAHILSFLITIVFILIYLKSKNKTFKNLIIMCVSGICVLINIVFMFSSFFGNYSNNGTPIEILESIEKNELEVIEKIEDDEYFRYSGNDLTDNVSVLGDEMSTQFYWSISNSDVSNFRKQMGLRDSNAFHYNDYDDRTSLMSLASVKYYVSSGDTDIPYGYEFYKADNGYNIYKNKNNIGMIYAYDDAISYDRWNELELVEKQEALTQTAIIDGTENDHSISFDEKKLSYTIKGNENIEINKNEIIVKQDNVNIDIRFNCISSGEVYFLANNLYWNRQNDEHWMSNTSTDIVLNTIDGSQKTLDYKNEDHERYYNKHNYVINLGYSNKEDVETTITFTKAGTYTFDSLEFIVLPLEDQLEHLDKLKNSIKVNDFKLLTNKIEANIDIDQDKIICINIPFSNGWKLYIDGKQQELLKVNGSYIGFKLGQGNYKIDVVYSTPLLKEGLIISVISSICFIFYIIYDTRKKYK